MIDEEIESDYKDDYSHGMDWGEDSVSIGNLSNYRKYQYDLVRDYVGNQILEVGSGASRSFTQQIIHEKPEAQRLLSIEPSKILLNEFSKSNKFEFPGFSEFRNIDIFDLDPEETGLFDTVFYIHVLEHIENDRAALDHTAQFLREGGHVLVQVPALPFLYSVHDEMLGHFRRYTKPMLKMAIDDEKYAIRRIWYNDPIGVIGSFLFFKLRKVNLNSSQGTKIVKNQGMIYDKYLIPIQSRIERLITFPFGLSLTAVLQKR